MTNVGSAGDLFIVKISGTSNSGIIPPNNTNTLGQKVFESLITQPQFTLDLSSWSGKGIYFLYIYDGSESLIAVRKIVLQ